MERTVSRIWTVLPRREELFAWAILFCAYLITAKLGRYLYLSGTSPVLIWPPVGIALAGLYLKGYRMWSAITLAALVAGISAGSMVPLIIGSTVGNTVQALVGAYLFRRFDFSPTIARLRDTLILFLAAILLTMIAPTILLGVRYLAGSDLDTLIQSWRILWSGGVLSVLILTPLITCWATDRESIRPRMLERLVVFAALITVSYLLFWTPYAIIGGIALVYVLLVPLFWLGLRFRPRSIALGLFVTAAIAIGGIVSRTDPALLGQRLFQTLIFFEIIAAIFYVLAAVVEERRAAALELGRRVAQLQEVLEKLKGQDSAKSEFLAVLAHELRNPLAPVLSTLELFKLKRAKSKDEVVLLEGAENRLHAMSRLLDDLLDVSRITEKRLKLQKERVEIAPIIERSAATVRHLLDKYNHRLEIADPECHAWVFADPLRLEQIFVNLLTNAAKYTEPGGLIRVSCMTVGSEVQVQINDNGVGIAPEMLGRIFEPFLQIQSRKGVSGVGIGLSLVKQLVEMHEGRIAAHSAGLGTGSTFTVHLPLTEMPKLKAPEPVRPVESKPVAEKMRILIVDDNEAGAEALARLLNFKGYETVHTYRGSDALVKIPVFNPHAVLLDIGLPDMDGYEVASAIRRSGGTMRLIALTGYGQGEDVAKAQEAGFDAHLTKPVGFSDIEGALRPANEKGA